MVRETREEGERGEREGKGWLVFVVDNRDASGRFSSLERIRAASEALRCTNRSARSLNHVD